jgi:hypothetical protein
MELFLLDSKWRSSPVMGIGGCCAGFIAGVDLFGGLTFNLAQSQRMMEVGPMAA